MSWRDAISHLKSATRQSLKMPSFSQGTNKPAPPIISFSDGCQNIEKNTFYSMEAIYITQANTTFSASCSQQSTHWRYAPRFHRFKAEPMLHLHSHKVLKLGHTFPETPNSAVEVVEQKQVPCSTHMRVYHRIWNTCSQGRPSVQEKSWSRVCLGVLDTSPACMGRQLLNSFLQEAERAARSSKRLPVPRTKAPCLNATGPPKAYASYIVQGMMLDLVLMDLMHACNRCRRKQCASHIGTQCMRAIPVAGNNVHNVYARVGAHCTGGFPLSVPCSPRVPLPQLDPFPRNHPHVIRTPASLSSSLFSALSTLAEPQAGALGAQLQPKQSMLRHMHANLHVCWELHTC